MSNNDKVSIVPMSATEDNKFKVLTLVIILGLLVTLIALILASVAISKKNDSSNQSVTCDCTGTMSGTGTMIFSDNYVPGDKIWMFQIGHYQSVTQYLDEASGTIRGYNVDVVNAVCQLANKNCQLVYDLYERCWDSQAGQRARGGDGLMGGWYDACVGWVHTYDRERTYLFSIDFEKVMGNVVVTTGKSGVNNLPSDFTGLKIGFLDGWATDEHCLGRFDEFKGFDQNDVNQVKHFTTESDLIQALTSEKIDFAFHGNITFILNSPDVKVVWNNPSERCFIGAVGLMMTKNQIELKNWWDAAFERLRVTSEYEAICERVSVVHGEKTGLDPGDECIM